MISRTLALPFVLGFFTAFVACSDDDGVGAPCTQDSDCAEGLVCDEHDGQASCQEPHGHDAGEDTEHEDTEDTAHETEDTEHAETEHASTGHDSGETGHDSGSTGHDHGSTGHATGTESGTGG